MKRDSLENTFCFHAKDAVRFGIDAAVILYNIRYWIAYHESNDKHFYEGRYWTYNSAEAFLKLFPFWDSVKKIYREIDKLVEQGALLKGNFNRAGFDRTNWYSLGPALDEILEPKKGEHLPKMGNAFPENGTPIPDVITDLILKRKEDEKENQTDPNINHIPFSSKEKFSNPPPESDPTSDTIANIAQLMTQKKKLREINELVKGQVEAYGDQVDIDQIESWLNNHFRLAKSPEQKKLLRDCLDSVRSAFTAALPIFKSNSSGQRSFKKRPRESPFGKDSHDLWLEKKGSIGINDDEVERIMAEVEAGVNVILQEKYGKQPGK